jgi:hypothetical protein
MSKEFSCSLTIILISSQLAEAAGECCCSFKLHVMNSTSLGETRIANDFLTGSAVELALFYDRGEYGPDIQYRRCSYYWRWRRWR